MKTKICTKCKKELSLRNFSRSKWTKSGRNYYCKSCQKQKDFEYRSRQNKHDFDRRKNLKRNYNITLDDYDKLFEVQDGYCAICGNPETIINPTSGQIYRLTVDHDHKTGKVRNLLCRRCNTMLGWMENNIDLIDSVLTYLEKHNGK